MYRSWLTTIAQPAKSSKPSSRLLKTSTCHMNEKRKFRLESRNKTVQILHETLRRTHIQVIRRFVKNHKLEIVRVRQQHKGETEFEHHWGASARTILSILTFPPALSNFASWTRFRSPPEIFPTWSIEQQATRPLVTYTKGHKYCKKQRRSCS